MPFLPRFRWRIRLFGNHDHDYVDQSRFENQNLVTNRVQVHEDGWIVGINAEAAGLDSATPAELVVYDEDGDLKLRSGIQTWNTTLQTRAYEVPPQDALRVEDHDHFFIGFWADPRNTRQWRLKRRHRFGHFTASDSSTSAPSRVTSWSLNAHAAKAWIDFVENEDPLDGRWRTAPSGEIGDTNPVFSGYLEHPEGEGGLDRSVAVHLIIYDDTENRTVVNRRIEVTPQEAEQGYFSGTFFAHTPGNSYRARYRHVDTWGEWSDFSDRAEYTVSAGPRKPGLTAPLGKVNTLDPSYAGTYSHRDGIASKAVQIRLQNADGTLLLGQSAALAMSGASFAVAHSTISQFPALAQGRGYRWLARVQDAQNRWSGWSDPAVFSTNSVPYVPTALAPSGGLYDRAGVLSATVSDPDGDGIRAVDFEIKNSTGATLTGYPKTVAGPFASGNRASLNAALDLTLGQSYSWRVRASDGNVYGDWSEFVSFIFANVPTSTMLAPVFGGLTNSVSQPSAEYGSGHFVLEGTDTNHSL
nr:hypothetical protein [Actinomycetota bacterium]